MAAEADDDYFGPVERCFHRVMFNGAFVEHNELVRWLAYAVGVEVSVNDRYWIDLFSRWDLDVTEHRQVILDYIALMRS